jgi:hypothetical protein
MNYLIGQFVSELHPDISHIIYSLSTEFADDYTIEGYAGNNGILNAAVALGKTNHVKRLLDNKLVNPSIDKNKTLKLACKYGNFNLVEYVVKDGSGRQHIMKGLYLIVDGGYRQVQCYMEPHKERMSYDEVFFSEWIESVRKDVECTFGILKSRFRILKNAVEYHSASVVQDIMMTCCILHNIILAYDKEDIDINLWEDDVIWNDLDPDIEDIELDLNSITIDELIDIDDEPSFVPIPQVVYASVIEVILPPNDSVVRRENMHLSYPILQPKSYKEKRDLLRQNFICCCDLDRQEGSSVDDK